MTPYRNIIKVLAIETPPTSPSKSNDAAVLTAVSLSSRLVLEGSGFEGSNRPSNGGYFVFRRANEFVIGHTIDFLFRTQRHASVTQHHNQKYQGKI